MSEEKAFEATPSRIARARREGDVPRASELVAWSSFAAAAAATLAALPSLAVASRVLFERAASGRDEPGALMTLAAAASAPLAAAGLAAVTATLAIAGGAHFTVPKFQLQRLSPQTGLRRMLSREAAIGAGRALIAALAVGLASAPTVRDAEVTAVGAGVPGPLVGVVMTAVRRSLASVLAVALAFAVLDAFLERKRRNARLRMSFDEIKRDHKQNEGDPLLRGRRRAAHRALVLGSIGRLAEAAFVIVNPVHVAIALEYAPPRVPVPRVLIRAIDRGARLVKVRARALRIPIVEHPELARRLLATCEIGAFVPPDCYDATARIVATLIAARVLT